MAAGTIRAVGMLGLALLTLASGCGAPAQPPVPGNRTTTTAPVSAGYLQDLDVVGPDSAWALTVGNQIIRTTDGGATWVLLTPPGPPRGMVSLASMDPSHAWVAIGSRLTHHDGSVYGTVDGGLSWHRTAVGSGLPQIGFLSDATGFLLLHQGLSTYEAVRLLGTTDGGRSWRLVAASGPRPNTPLYYGQKSGFTFRDPVDGWITGTFGGKSVVMYVTHDGGATWRTETLPAPPGVAHVKGSVGTLPPRFFGSGGVLPVIYTEGALFYRTGDGGRTWIPGAPIGAMRYSVPDANHIFATNGLSVYWSADAGAHWTVMQPTRPLFVDTFVFWNRSDGWASGGGELLRSTDGGSTWIDAGAQVQLPDWAGFTGLPGMRMIGSGSAPLWDGKDGYGPFTPADLGFRAGLWQDWVTAAAFGPTGHSISVLPIPVRFIRKHPGVPLEVHVTILKFDNAKAPRMLLRSPTYNRNGSSTGGRVRPAIDGGWAYREEVPYTGETDYVFQWAHGPYWNQVSVFGYRLPVARARSLAASLGE